MFLMAVTTAMVARAQTERKMTVDELFCADAGLSGVDVLLHLTRGEH